MSIIFGYFQYDPMFFLLPMIIEAIVAILLNIMLFRSGRDEDGRQKQKILVSISIINVVFILLPFVLPSVIGINVTDIELTILRIYGFVFSVLGTVPFFITYGIMMYRYGKVNRDSLNKNYMVSAWIFLVCNGFFVISVFFPVLALLTSSQAAFSEIYGVLRFVFLLVYLVGWVFLALHGKIAGINNFMYAGILGCCMVVLMILLYNNIIISF